MPRTELPVGWGQDLPSFFARPQAPAVLKHEVLRQYLRPFVSKVGSQWGRVVVVDGFAGAGAYKDGTAGSPVILRDEAVEIDSNKGRASLDFWCVERGRRESAALRMLVSPERVLSGSLKTHLDRLLAGATESPLFMFLDPYGFGLDLATMAQKILDRPTVVRNGRRPQTEVLVHFSRIALSRCAGKVDLPAEDDPTAPATVESTDRAMGSDWWRSGEFANPDSDGWADRVVERWCREFEELAPRYRAWRLSVPRLWGAPALYDLVLMTASPEGGWVFADALPRALARFYGFTHGDQDELFGRPDQNKQAAVDLFERNVRDIVARRGTTLLRPHPREAFSEVLGLGGIPELRKALRNLYRAGHIHLAPTTGEVPDMTVGPGATPTLI